MDLDQELDLVRRVPGLSGLVGVEGEAAVAPGDQDGCEEAAGLAGSLLPVCGELGARLLHGFRCASPTTSGRLAFDSVLQRKAPPERGFF